MAAVGAAGVLLVAGCSGNSGGGSGVDGGTVTLKVNFWGGFGLDELKGRYEAANPNIKISLTSGEYNAQHEAAGTARCWRSSCPAC